MSNQFGSSNQKPVEANEGKKVSNQQLEAIVGGTSIWSCLEEAAEDVGEDLFGAAVGGISVDSE